MKKMVLIWACSLALAACAARDHQQIGEMQVSAPWMREMPPGAAVAGGFVTLKNTGGADDRLVAVASASCGRIEIHEMRQEGGVAQMRPLQGGLPVPAGGTVALQPGGLHLMCLQPARRLMAGERVPVTLTFARNGTRALDFEVRGLAGTGGGEHAHH